MTPNWCGGAEVQSGAASSDKSPHEVVVAVAGSGQLGETAAPVVDSGLVEEGGLCESGLYKFDAGEVNLGKIESGSRYAGI